MLGQYLPSHVGRRTQIFSRGCAVDATEWETWIKPKGITSLSIIGASGGGGGGGGCTGIAGSPRGGGGAGGGSPFSRVIGIPADCVPDVLYVSAGRGGAGGTAGNAGSLGVRSFVAVAPSAGFVQTQMVWWSANGQTTFGGAGLVSGGGAGGAASTIGGISLLGCAGSFTGIAGQAGAAGGAHTGAVGGVGTIASSGNPFMGGTGGGGVTAADFAGGLITPIASSFLSDRAPVNAAAGSSDGSGGVFLWAPLFGFCGMGGGSSNAGVGGNGGPGALGCGGGGGGGGTTGGTGGDGGNGFVMMVCT
jgi:hypothetical protein